MKKYHCISILLGIVLAAVFTLNGCLEDDEKTLVLPDESNRFVDITDPYDLQQALKIAEATVVNGDLPASSSGNNYLSSSINSIKVNSGSDVVLPLMYSGFYEIETVYIQVVGADGKYYSVKPVITASSENSFGYISIAMPKNIEEGDFNVRYKVKDSSGSISNMVVTLINITNEVISCENAHNSGQAGLTFTTLYLGKTAGPVSIYYDTYSVKDRIDIYQGKTWITGTGEDPGSPIPPLCDCNSTLPGFVGRQGYLNFDFNPHEGQNITVVVSGCLNGGTSWEWHLSEAPECK
ncbi:MAG: hypothetical protein LBP72_07285 [Dysgonamonadaceae bacterium]|jgi:hypothetical protein|nr:hypothetical protein [Dysgonamonadaceae bacterium]